MATPETDPTRRRARGFQPAARLVSARIRAAGEARGFAVARLLTQWAEIVGPEIATLCQPLRVGYGRRPGAGGEGLGANLTLIASGAAAPLVQMRLPAIRERVNACYGYNAIARITITQTHAEAPFGMAEAQAPFTPAPPDAGLTARAGALCDEITDPGLRAALSTLAVHILNNSAKRKAER